jgi:hypothetical protein
MIVLRFLVAYMLYTLVHLGHIIKNESIINTPETVVGTKLVLRAM